MRCASNSLSRLALGLSLSALSAAFPSTAAMAQEPGVAIEGGDGAAIDEPAADGTAIVVTGTRIERVERVTPNPIVSYLEDDIDLSGEIDLAELLSQSPALYASQTDFESAGLRARLGAAGLDLLNLRNLESDRTLVLVNGRRHVGSVAGVAMVDINTIPNSLVERVDILTGGVSAIYGADGVSGVVNFITKRDFEGFEFNAQQGISGQGDAPSTLLNATIGGNFAGGRGNIALAYDYRHQDSLAFTDRDLGSARLISNPAEGGGDDPNIPDYILAKDVRYFGYSPNGAIYLAPDFLFYGDFDPFAAPSFDGDGSVYDPGRLGGGIPYGLHPSNTAVTIGGSGTSLDDYAGDLQPEKDAHIVNLLGHYDIAPGITLFAEAKYARTEARSEGAPSSSLFYVPADNPFIPASIAAAITPGNMAGLGLPDGLFVRRDNFDFGRYTEDATRDTYRGVIGLEGDLTDHIRFEFSYVYGRTDAKVVQENYIIGDRFLAAIDVLDLGGGNVACWSEIDPSAPINPYNTDPTNPLYPMTFTPGVGQCQPLNIFGNGAADQAAIDWITADLVNRSRLQQHVVNAYISGDLGDSLSLPGGPVSFVLGAEYRKEMSRFRPDDLLTLVSPVDGRNSLVDGIGVQQAFKGEFDVAEIFGELRLPILADRPGVHRLDLEGAVRHADYSTVGGATSWKIGSLYAPIPDISFRGTYAQAVRAPNIQELYSPTLGTFALIDDPCYIANVGNGTGNRRDNCVAIGADPATLIPSAGLTSLTVTGNPDLDEERARTWTVGVLVQPAIAPGLVASLDWYDIRIKDAIIQTTPQQFLDLCVDQASIDNPFCANITRGPGGEILSLSAQPYNVSQISTAGADFSLSYSFAPDGLGAFNVRGTVGYLDKLKYENAPGVTENKRGVIGAPKWVATGDVTWRKGHVLLNYGINYVGPQSYFSRELLKAQPDIAPQSIIDVDDAITHDLRAEYITDAGMSFYLGANNVTDEKPDTPLVSSPVSYMGRYLYAGVKVKLGALGF